jgi:DNA helicase HerA-like ATPase
MCSRIKDTRYEFLFKPGEYTPDLAGKVNKDLSELLLSWVGNDKPITILDISDVPSEIMMSIAGTLLNIVYEAMFWGQDSPIGGRQQPLLIALEEAHSYLRSGEHSIASRTVQRIAKEGRKYGVGLLLVTQRPSELDETVLSQCGTIIALRMNNSKDRGYVAAAIQDELQTVVDLLPSLRTGEGIISGEGVSIPSRVQFYKLTNAPKSVDPEVSKEWSKNYSQTKDDYNKLVSLWRNKKFRMEETDNE